MIWLQSQTSKFQTHFNNKYLKYFLWTCYQVNATISHWSLVNIGSGNGLVTSANVDPDLWRHMASLGHNELKVCYLTASSDQLNQYWLNSTPGGAHMRKSIGLALVHIMACCLFITKPLSKPMLGYCQLDPQEQNFTEILIKIQNFSLTKMHLKILSVKWQPFCSVNEWVIKLNSLFGDIGVHIVHTRRVIIASGKYELKQHSSEVTMYQKILIHY